MRGGKLVQGRGGGEMLYKAVLLHVETSGNLVFSHMKKLGGDWEVEAVSNLVKSFFMLSREIDGGSVGKVSFTASKERGGDTVDSPAPFIHRRSPSRYDSLRRSISGREELSCCTLKHRGFLGAIFFHQSANKTTEKPNAFLEAIIDQMYLLYPSIIQQVMQEPAKEEGAAPVETQSFPELILWMQEHHLHSEALLGDNSMSVVISSGEDDSDLVTGPETPEQHEPVRTNDLLPVESPNMEDSNDDSVETVTINPDDVVVYEHEHEEMDMVVSTDPLEVLQ